MRARISESRRGAVALAPVAFLAAYAAVRLLRPDLVPRLIREDGAFEYLQVLLYAATAVLALRASLRATDPFVRWSFVVLCVAAGVVTLEEVSWGQRLLGFDTPSEIARRNTQDEMSLHNLGPLQRLLHPAYIVVGLVAGLGWLTVRRGAGRPAALLRGVLPGPATMLYFLPVAAFYAYVEATGWPETGWLRIQDQEVFETLLAAGFAAFALERGRRRAPRPGEADGPDTG